MNLIITIFLLIIFLKLFVFWLWLWQLKEYHLGRFLAHFEAQKIKKLLSSFWRLKYPKFTKKTTAIFITGALLAILWFFFFSPFVLIILAPLFSSLVVLLFQIPTVFWRKIIINKAKKKREQFQNLLVIAITGSYGKTSTKEFLATILSEKFRVLKTKEHQNSEVGISQCILNELTKEHEIFVCEMGAYNKGGVKLLCDIAKPKIGIITGINEQHLATFGSMENLISAEGGEELIESIPKEGLMIFNGYNKYCQEIYDRTIKPKKICGKVPMFDIWAENIITEREFISFEVFSGDGQTANFKLNLLGPQNIENILLATCSAKELGMTLAEIAIACQKLKPLPHQMELKKGINGLDIIDATYSANPNGVMAHLEYLKTFPGRKVMVMPCLIELGFSSKEVHRRIGRKISEICDLAIITTKDRFKEIKEGAVRKEEKVLCIESPKEIFEEIKSFGKKGDVILLEGRLTGQLIKQLTIGPEGPPTEFWWEAYGLDQLTMAFCPISISLSPNTEKDDILLAFKLLFQPWKWKTQSDRKSAMAENLSEVLEEEFKKFLGVKYAVSFNSGRSALMAILNSFNLKKGDEVLLQAFTCNAAINPILWSGLKPVYIDCNERAFNIDIEDLRWKITPQSKAVMIQHTFGLPAQMDEILEICRQQKLILIEDCAHALGAEYKGRQIGTFGQAAFFSFSRDKVISSVYGGMAVTNDENLAKSIQKYAIDIKYPSNFWIFQQLLHPILMNFLILPTYSILGKYLLILFQWLHLLSKAVHWKEKRGKKPSYFPKRLPEALAHLALNQFKKLDKFNIHRKEIAKFYFQALENTSFELPQILDNRDHIFLRFTVKHLQAREIIKKAWKSNLLIGDWYDKVIAPHDTKLEKMQYRPGSCPKAEKLAKETLNLPTHINISKQDAQKIVEFLKLWK